MNITISAENKVLLEELKDEALIIKQEVTKLSISLLIQLKTVLFQFLISYKEYSLTNIREYGLGEILMNRAMRFFKLENDRGEKKIQIKKSIKSVRKGGKYLMKKSVKVVLYPFYLVILLLIALLKPRNGEKKEGYVKNIYKE
ncbi:MAG TPA: hypothetical protein VKY37_10015 [Brumimicrobium sp.]|nr:hypothetical protein [Brumimicrobium sp.]